MISIAMATYNGERFIVDQINSIISQSITDWELIICDDCSTDGTINILNTYEEKDSRIKVFRNEQNLGYARNFEKAISLCVGDYIALADQDDIWLPNHLKVLIENIGDYCISWACAKKMDAEGNISQNFVWNPGIFKKQISDYLLYHYIIKGNSFAGNSMLINKELINLSKSFSVPKGFAHDEWLLFLSCFNKGICWDNKEIITYRRCHDFNVTGIPLKQKGKLKLVINFFCESNKRRIAIVNRLKVLKEYLKKQENDLSRTITKELEVIINGAYSINPCAKILGMLLYKKRYLHIYFYETTLVKKIIRLFSYLFGIL